MILPAKYSRFDDLSQFIEHVIKAFGDTEALLNTLTDGKSDEYKALHLFSTKAHVPVIAIRHLGNTYHLKRVSNIRGTVGYEQYAYHHYDVDELQYDERIVTYRYFMDEWLPWVTIKL